MITELVKVFDLREVEAKEIARRTSTTLVQRDGLPGVFVFKVEGHPNYQMQTKRRIEDMATGVRLARTLVS